MSEVARHCAIETILEAPLASSKKNVLTREGFDFSVLQDLISDVVFVLEVLPESAYRFLYVNARFEAATGMPAKAIIGHLVDEVIPPDSLPLVKRKYRQAIESGCAVHWDEVSVYPSGTKVGEVTIMPAEHQATGKPLLVGTVHDVTERHETQVRLAELEERWRLALDATGAAAWEWDQHTDLIRFSPQWLELLGREPASMPADAITLRLLVHPDDIARVRDTRHAIVHGAIDRFGFEMRMRHADGSWVWVRCHGRVFGQGEQAGVRVLGTLIDISAAKRSQEILWQQANYDNLTGLPNRHLFLDRLRQAIQNTRRGAPAFSLLYIDLDQFKEINDTLGHSIGDRLLKEAARRLVACVRATDTVCRLGGDEFTVLLTAMHNSQREDAYVIERIAHTTLDAMARPFKISEESLHLSASIGITHFPRDAHDLESLLKHADQAMYEAKRLGRNRFVYFSHAMQEQAQARRRMIDDLRRAIRADELHMHYQPIIDLESGRICKAEALLRWRHPQRGWVGPDEFIPLCEETGLIIEVGEWAFKTVVNDAARWLGHGQRDLKIGLNMSPMQLMHGAESCARCVDFLVDRRLPRNAIIVEVTESSLLQNDTAVAEQLRQMNEHGIALALDDFGTGYSALSYLQQYAFQFLKIDRSFVRNMGRTGTKQALCETIILMAHKLGMQVIAEGIESDQEAALLRAAGCDFGQGYNFFRPAPAEHFESWLASRECVGLHADRR